MRKLLISLVLLGSFVFAEPMPEGSKQFQVLVSYVDQTSGIVFACLPELDRPGIQVMCIGNMGETHQTTPLLDRVLIEENGLEPQQDFWVSIPDGNRYTRAYAFADGGTLEAIFAPEDSNQLYVFYTP